MYNRGTQPTWQYTHINRLVLTFVADKLEIRESQVEYRPYVRQRYQTWHCTHINLCVLTFVAHQLELREPLVEYRPYVCAPEVPNQPIITPISTYVP